MKGIIALDIDGTITAQSHSLDPEVIYFLDHLYQEGFVFIFITGRSFHWGYSVLQALSFPYFLAVHNGVLLLEMPSKKIISKKHLNKEIFPKLDTICSEEESHYIVYAGYAYDDMTYYCPDYFSSWMRKYLEKRYQASKEPWQHLSSFSALPIDDFASVKCFGRGLSAKRISMKIEVELGLHVPMIKDLMADKIRMDLLERDQKVNDDENTIYVLQATHNDANKGSPLRDLKQMISSDLVIIAAGDDLNDMPMFASADIIIAMFSAPVSLKLAADIIAPSVYENGIIEGLKAALKRI